MNTFYRAAYSLTEKGAVPDPMVRLAIRILIRKRLLEITRNNGEPGSTAQARFMENMRMSPIAVVPEKANAQHYEVPAAFFEAVLGPHLKYSSAYWPDDVVTLADAEAAGLRETCGHARLRDGQTILELGCGWGSLTRWMAKAYPNSHIVAVSNSQSQREFIEARARQENFRNIEVQTCDMNNFDIGLARFDRVVSVEMFEHMRNWPKLFSKVHGWLKPGGLFFMHIFVHRTAPYLFEDRGPSDWMSRHFFTGGMMPCEALPLAFQDHLRFVQRWWWNGTHYEKTANAWLANMDQARGSLWPLFVRTYGNADAQTWWMRWRIFFMACAELFGYARGEQWGVSHYLFERPGTNAA
ncbi:MAG TPA: cyclopropane-fatty-acyl-phospholipid synthase family protein [Nitrospira sp.]